MAAMRLAKDYAKECDVDVVLMRVYNAIEEPHVLPEGFIESPHPLQRTAIDAMNDASAIAAARKFGVPEYALIQGIIDEAIAANTGADWVVLTNADVMPFPSSYVVMALLSEAGPDVLSYTRMGGPKHAKDAAHGPTTLHLTAFEKYMRAISTPPRELTRHPGIDGFGLKADLMPCLDFGNAHWGCAPFGQLAWSELRRVSQSCAMWIDGVSGKDAPSVTRLTIHPAESGWRRRRRLRLRRQIEATTTKSKPPRFTSDKGHDMVAWWRHLLVDRVPHSEPKRTGLNRHWGVCMNKVDYVLNRLTRHQTGGSQGHVDSKRGAPACDPKRSAAEIASLGQQCTDVWHAHRGSPLDSPLTMAPTDELLAYFYPKLSRGPKNVVRWDLGVEESQKLTS